MGSSASQRTVGPYMTVPPEEAGQADFSLPSLAVSTEVDILVFDCPPQPFNEDVVVAAFLPDQLILISSACSLATKSPEVNWQP